ncbi:histidine kinase [Kitasatospora sp. NPDC008115]|uniref:histidine kinase n=1 Tax=Kitasatospora sp. NPDC008115 TaxID=3364022 RepID=UPI0036EBA7B7
MSENHHVLLLDFTDRAACRAAFDEAAHLPGLRQSAIVERLADGTLEVPAGQARGAGAPTVGAGVVGGLAGLLGGPIGVLLGWAAGTALGTAAEARRDHEGGAGLIVLSEEVDEGHSMLVLDLAETSPAPADDLAARHGTTLRRIPAAELAERVEAVRRAADQPGEHQ